MAGLDKIVGEQLPLLYFGNTSSSIKQRRIPTMADISKWLLPPPPDGVWSFQGFITLLIFFSILSSETLTLTGRNWNLYFPKILLRRRGQACKRWGRNMNGKFRRAPLPIESHTRPPLFPLVFPAPDSRIWASLWHLYICDIYLARVRVRY